MFFANHLQNSGKIMLTTQEFSLKYYSAATDSRSKNVPRSSERLHRQILPVSGRIYSSGDKTKGKEQRTGSEHQLNQSRNPIIKRIGFI